jgi:hypothetical protein
VALVALYLDVLAEDEKALERLRTGDLLVVLVDQVESSIALIDKCIASLAPAARTDSARPHADLGIDANRKPAALAAALAIPAARSSRKRQNSSPSPSGQRALATKLAVI